MQGDWIQHAHLFMGRFCWLAWHFVSENEELHSISLLPSEPLLQGLRYLMKKLCPYITTHSLGGKKCTLPKIIQQRTPITTGTQNWPHRLEPGSRVAYCASAYRPWNVNCNQHNIHIVILGWGLIFIHHSLIGLWKEVIAYCRSECNWPSFWLKVTRSKKTNNKI